MGLSSWLADRATRTCRVLLVEAPGGWLARVRVEQQLRDRGWRTALSPGDADVLAVCGTPGAELAGVVTQLWEQLPGPRARLQISSVDAAVVAQQLDRAADELRDLGAQRRDASARPDAEDLLKDHDDGDHGDMDHGDMDHGDMDHGDMDHGDMEMAPAGVPLAEGGADRDGLEMDVLQVPLGPVLPHWPAGLVLRCSLHGDLVASADVERMDTDRDQSAADGARGEARLDAAIRCDNVAGLLSLAGWDDGAGQARAVRDLLLFGGTPLEGADAVQRLRRRVTGARLLRWSLRGVGVVGADMLEEHALPQRLGGDVWDRLLGMLDRAAAVLGSSEVPAGPAPRRDRAAFDTDALPHLVAGLDLAAARLVVASLDLDPQPVRREAAHG